MIYRNDEDIIENWKTHKLSENEIDICIDKGLLAPNIRQLVVKPYSDKYYSRNCITDIQYKSQGVKLFYLKNHDIIFPSFYLTDFFFICCVGHKPIGNINKNGLTTWYYDGPSELIVIPLKYVSSCEYVYSRTLQGNTKELTKEVKKSAVAGAVVGGIIAGPTGAVVGAVANNGTKTKTVMPAFRFDEDVYDLRINIKDSQKIVFEDYIRKDNANLKKGEKTEKEIATAIETSRSIIARSRGEFSETEMAHIVAETIGDKSKNKEKESGGFFSKIFSRQK